MNNIDRLNKRTAMLAKIEARRIEDGRAERDRIARLAKDKESERIANERMYKAVRKLLKTLRDLP